MWRLQSAARTEERPPVGTASATGDTSTFGGDSESSSSSPAERSDSRLRGKEFRVTTDMLGAATQVLVSGSRLPGRRHK